MHCAAGRHLATILLSGCDRTSGARPTPHFPASMHRTRPPEAVERLGELHRDGASQAGCGGGKSARTRPCHVVNVATPITDRLIPSRETARRGCDLTGLGAVVRCISGRPPNRTPIGLRGGGLHLCGLRPNATRVGLSNFSNLMTCQDCSGEFDLSSTACALRTRLGMHVGTEVLAAPECAKTARDASTVACRGRYRCRGRRWRACSR